MNILFVYFWLVVWFYFWWCVWIILNTWMLLYSVIIVYPITPHVVNYVCPFNLHCLFRWKLWHWMTKSLMVSYLLTMTMMTTVVLRFKIVLFLISVSHDFIENLIPSICLLHLTLTPVTDFKEKGCVFTKLV